MFVINSCYIEFTLKYVWLFECRMPFFFSDLAVLKSSHYKNFNIIF